MIDSDKVIKGLEYCTTHYNCVNREDKCPYIDCCAPIDNATGNSLMHDALELLKELKDGTVPDRKDATPDIEGGGMTWFFVCGECHSGIKDRWKFCPECGRKIKWT